jgi:hypothetical protein
MNDKHIINEYFNTYYPKKKVFIHNEMVELLFGLFLGFFFSALKDTISNRAVQIVQRLDDPRIANNFIKDNEKIITQIEEYAEGNKKLEEKLKNIEEVLGDLQKKLKEAKTSPETETIPSPASTPIEEKNPTVIAIIDLTIKITEIFTELQKSGEANQNDIKELIKEIGKNFDKIGLPQEIISKKIVENVENANKKNQITKSTADEIIQFSKITVLPSKKPQEKLNDTEGDSSVKIEKNNQDIDELIAINDEGEQINFILINKSSIDISKKLIKEAFKNKKINEEKRKQLFKQLKLIEKKLLSSPTKIEINKNGIVSIDGKETEIQLKNTKPQKVKISNPDISDNLDKEIIAQIIKQEAPKEKESEKLTIDWFNNKKFDVSILFNNETKLRETGSKGSSIRIESDAIIVVLTDYKLSESNFGNNEKEIFIESKIIKYLFETEEKKIEIMGRFEVELSKDQFNNILETKIIPKEIVKSLIGKIKEKFDKEKAEKEAKEVEGLKPITLDEVLNSTLDFYYIFNQFILKNKSIDRFAFNMAKKPTKLSIIKFDKDLADISLKNFSITAEDINEMPKENKEKFLYINEKGPITLNGDIKVSLVDNDIEINTEKNSIKFGKVFTNILFDEIIKKANKTKKEQIERNEALNKEGLEKKKNTLLNKKFELNNLFNDLKLKETEDENNYFGLKKQDSNYLLFAKLTNYELSENDINDISKSKKILIESKIIKYLFEAQENKISITGEFSIELSEQKINDIIETKLIQQDDINRLIDKIRKAFNIEVKKAKEKATSQEKTTTEEEPTKVSKAEKPKAQIPDKWPKTLYFALKKKSNGTTIGLKKDSKLKKEAPSDNGSYIKFNFKKVENDEGIYIGEINYDEKDNFTKTSLSSILEAVILNQERKKQLTVNVTFDNDVFIVTKIQKGKLTDSSASTWQKLISTGNIGANKSIVDEKFRLGKLNNNKITIKDYSAPISGENMVLIFNIADKLLYLKLNEDDLIESITTLRTLSRQKQETLNIFLYNASKKTINNFVLQDFLNILPSIIEKIKQIYKDKYTKALNESRKQKLPKFIDNRFGWIGNFDAEEGFKNSYQITQLSQNTTNTSPKQNNPSIEELEQRSNSLKEKSQGFKPSIPKTSGNK